MRPHDGMLRSNRHSPGNASPLQAVVDLLNTRVHGLQLVESLAELGGEASVGQRSVGKEGVTTTGRPIQQVEECRAGGLLLKGHVGVPGDGVGVRGEELGTGAVVGATVHEVNFGEALGGA